MFSLTPLRFRSINLSGSRLNELGRLRIMAMTVFSLKPARTSLTTAAFVSGGCGDRWADEDNAAAQQTAMSRINLIRIFLIPVSLRLGNNREHITILRGPLGPNCSSRPPRVSSGG